MYTAKVMLIAVAAFAIAACASSPTPQKRYESLVKVATSPKPQCRKYDSSSALGRDDTGSPECVQIQTAWVERRHAALDQIEEAELKAMPVCAREWEVSETARKTMKMAPDDPLALAKVLRDGYTNPRYFDTPCAAQVCAWLALAKRETLFCYSPDVAHEGRKMPDHGPVSIPGRAAAASAEASRESPSRVESTRSE